jgi:hypothetical protein
MPEPSEIDRIAAAMNALRPDWRVTSLITFLTKNHATRAYRDLAIAACAVAADPRTTTPQLLNQHGPWWVAAQTAAGSATAIHFERCDVIGHTSFPKANCSACRAENLEGTHPASTPERARDRAEIAARGAALAKAQIRPAPRAVEDL